MHIEMIQTMALGVLALMLGGILNDKIPYLKRICIPAAVTGGFIISFITLIIHSISKVDFTFDGTLKDVCMLFFFTTAGLQCNFKVIRKGGKPLIILIIIVGLLICFQNAICLGICRICGLSPLLGMSAGSITMAGGHGTAGGFSPILENMGLRGAASITMATATFGLIAGSIIGGPIGNRLINKYKLNSISTITLDKDDKIDEVNSGYQLTGVCLTIAIAGVGTLLSDLFAKLGITVPTYFGSLILAIVFRNITELIPSCPKLPMKEAISFGNICLALFLGMAMVSLRLWELYGIALPLFIILSAQVTFMLIYVHIVAFPLLGKNFDAAVLCGGLCGFGLGATPNALANMHAICDKHGYSPIPFIVVPVVGAAFLDVINITVITIILNTI